MPAHREAQGNATRTSAGSTTLIDCSAYGSRLRLKTLDVGISVFAVTGEVKITDGTTTYFSWEAITTGGGQPPFVDIPDGFDWGDGKDIILTTIGAITVHAVVTAEVRG